MIIEFIKNNLLPISTLVVSLVTFYITLRNHLETRASLKLIQVNKEKATQLLEPDRLDNSSPDVYWDSKYRVLSEVIITNNSSKPISIIEFTLNDEFTYNSYTKPGNEYQVTIRPNKQHKNGITFFGSSLIHAFEVKKNVIVPISTIPPHTSIRGILFFNIGNDKSKINIGENTLKLHTSRKVFVFKLKILEEYYSLLQPEDKFS